METLLRYLLDASVGIVLFYSVFWLFLRKETFHLENRIYLIVALLSAVFLPLFPLRYSFLVETAPSQVQAVTDTFKNIPVAVARKVENGGYSWQQIVTLVYFTGVILFSFRLLVQSVALIGLILTNKAQKINGIYILRNSKYEFPFSFFNVVFIHPKYNTQEELPEILAHEKVHIRENHWFDLLIIELLTVIFWFNPFIWFFEQSIKQNHEYLADRGVLAQGHNVSRYRALLVNQLMGVQVIGLANNLNFALNANRLKMMTKKKTSVFRRIKFVWALPALALLMFAFAEPEYVFPEQTETKSNPMSIVPMDKGIRIIGTVVDENGEPLPGTSVVVKGGTRGIVAAFDGTFTFEIGKNESIVLSFVGKKTLVDSYSEMELGEKKNGVINRKYIMKDAVQVLYNQHYSGEQLVSPPPPPPPTAKSADKNKENVPPPPPPPVNKGGEEMFYIVEDMPQYPGGFGAMQDYVAKMQQKLAQGKSLKGKAEVSFTVNEKGKVSDIKVVEKDNDGAAKGAVVIASEMPDWTPGKQRGKAVPVKYLLPVEFK